MEMTAIFGIMRLDVARVILRILELPLDDQIGPVKVIRFLLKRDAIIIAVGGCGHMIGVELDHPLPMPPWIRFVPAERSACRGGSIVTSFQSSSIGSSQS
jgi:hypothetical protein